MEKVQGIQHQSCPAYQHCRALEANGIAVLTSNDCAFVGTDFEHLLDDADRAQDRALAQELLATVVALLESHGRALQANEQVADLRGAFDAVFAAHLDLWKTMIEAARSGRQFLDIELDHYQRRIREAQANLDTELESATQATALRALASHDRVLKERYDLQFDAALIADIDQLVGNVTCMRPTLIVGDKGIAKTQIARFVAGLFGEDPIVISVKGDMMSDELIGKLKHDRINNTFVFQEGMLLAAMRKGVPILLDEINFGDQAIIARLQDILLRRSGDTVSVQESGEEALTVHSGFVVFATANEASERYRHREILDPAIRDRFDIIMRSYPDVSRSSTAVASDDPLTACPTALLRLALSSAVDDWGMPSPHIDLAMLESFVRLAHVTQYLYSVPAKDVVLDLSNNQLTSAVLEESAPLMTDCITPRTVSRLVASCAAGNLPGFALDAQLLERTIRSLDQAGSTRNYELALQTGFLLDITTGVTRPSMGEGGVPITQFIDLDDQEDQAGTLAGTDLDEGESPAGFAGLSHKARTALLAQQLSVTSPLP